MITILGVQLGSNYYDIPGLDLYDKKRDAYNYTGSDLVITHAPCQQWSRLKAFANEDPQEKNLAYHCFDLVTKNVAQMPKSQRSKMPLTFCSWLVDCCRQYQNQKPVA